MALLKDRVKKSEDKIDAIFKILDDTKKEKAEKEKTEDAKIAVEDYKNKLLNRIFKYLLIPIILLIISAIINWIMKFQGG